MKKISLIALALAALLCLQSCGIIILNDLSGKKSGDTDTEESGRAGETGEAAEIVIDQKSSEKIKSDADEALRSLQTVSLSGMRLLIAATDKMFYEGDGSLTALSSDRVLRIDKIKQKLDANVVITTYGEDALYDGLKEAIEKGEYFADVIAIPQRLVGKFASDGLIRSLRTIPGLDLSAPYFDADATAAFSGGHGTYAVTGEGCFEPEKTYCVYFNKQLAADLGLDLYKLVKDGQWTLEKYVSCVLSAVSAGKSGAVLKLGENYKRMLLTASGFDLVKSEADAVPAAMTFSSEYEKTVALLSSLPEAAVLSTAPSAKFLSGDTLFYIDTVVAAEDMADSELVWGMLPFPKYDEKAEYGSYTSAEAMVLCVPVGAADDRTSGDFIEAFNAVSVEYIKYDFIYHNMLDVLRDNDSVNSLNTLLGRTNHDFVIAMRSGYPTLYENTAAAFDQLVTGKLTFEEYKEKETDVAEYLAKWFPIKNK